MKILYYCAHPLFSRNDPAGYATHIREVIKGFEQQGHTVAPLIMGEQGKPAETTANTGAAPPQSTVKTLIKKLVPTALWEYLKERKLTQFDGYAEAELRQLIAAFQPDLVYERACFAQDSGVKVLSEMDIPHFMEVNAPMVEEHQRLTGGKASKRAAVVERLQIEKPTRVVVVSTALRQYFSERFKIDSQKILVTPNAFQHEHITQEAYDSKDLANELGLENKLVLGFVGSIFRWHGLDQLIDAFATFQPDPDLRLLIVGNGDSMDELQTQAKELGLADRVIFTGSIKHAEVFQYINLMDICIMARSNWYGSPVKIFEYGAMKKTIIAPDVVPVQDVMVDGEDGILVDESPEALRLAIEKLITDPALRERMAQHFYDKVWQNHRWIDVSSAILNETQKL